ncbi:MAG: ribosome small subunit-dependent GTPase A [Ignavibacteriaceae bacterium]|nr:ribosome small subunit-dependent GTPase A [Ignavibacteriaceae bacterium]HRN27120.1 ribosome small subunit-dependent GTPase A [Ignavibacteriaceae bacterium]HRP91862.1 ribosome small subunit-dependent GTPase A [Ignavibacteriaceae bacterium]
MNNLAKLGFDNWFEDKFELSKTADFWKSSIRSPSDIPSGKIVRVISVNKNSYVVSNGEKDIYVELTGKFLFNSDSALDLPTVGDFVFAQLFDDDTLAIIQDILPRKSLLKRKAAGKKIDYQLIAANIDIAIIMQSLDSNFNLRRLERYLVMINESNITPLILLSKSDLISPEETEEKENQILKILPDAKIFAFSNNKLNDIENIKTLFTPYKTYCLLGSSGVGKTTLLNNLIHQDLYKTQPIREKDGRGKHTTTKRELIILENGAIIIDNPGMRELGIISIESGISSTFNEIDELSDHCRYKDCTHTVEAGCAVMEAVERGKISEERYENFLKLYKESKYNEMSYVEKRQKDKKWGKFFNSAMKEIKNRKDNYK